MDAGNREDALVDARRGEAVLRLGLSLLGIVFIGAAWMQTYHAGDLYAYWAVNPSDPYTATDSVLGRGVFRYAPPFALLFAPLSLLPFEAVQVLWLGLQLGALWYVARGWFLALALFPPVWMDLAYGNINILLGAMIVAGFRHPAVWSFALLTKITPGVGVLWFLGRREWRNLALVGGVTLGIVSVSVFVQGAGVWREWFGVLAEASGQATPTGTIPGSLPVRVALAAGIVLLAGLTNRPWLVPFGVVLAMPVLWLIAFAPSVALARRHPDPRRLKSVVVAVIEHVRGLTHDERARSGNLVDLEP